MSKSKFPPVWALPHMMTMLPRMLWAQYRRNYDNVMIAGRDMVGAPVVKERAFRGYEPGSQDVFVCTYSKSGTYWMIQIVTQIAGRGAADFEHIHDIVPWPETIMPGYVNLKAPTWQSAPAQMRAIKTHAEAQYVPYNANAKYIVVLRDPKDVLISGYHFADSVAPGLSSIGIDHWVDAFIAGNVPYGKWVDQVASYWPWRDRENVLLVTYGEMKQDSAKIVDAVAKIMQVQLCAEEIEMVIEKSGFAYMKANQLKFSPPIISLSREPVDLIRNGKKGESSDVLTAEKMKQVDEAMKVQLQMLGSDFPYDNYFGATV